MIITDNNIQITENSVCYFEDISIGLSSSKTFFILLENEPDNINLKIGDNSVFSFFKTNNGEVVQKSGLELNDLTLNQQNGYRIYTVSMMAFGEEEGRYSTKINFDIDGDSTEFEVVCDLKGLDENLAVALQNMKSFVSDEWVKAMYETDYDTKSTDYVKYNEKLREYLMNVMELDTLKGTYKGLQSALNFFGFGDLLDIREHWHSNNGNDIKYTTVRNAVLDEVDKNLTGFDKTNQMSFVYQINDLDGYDEDGLPVYINFLSETEKVLKKLWLMERIFENNFLNINTHIVDIIGEFQAVLGLEYNFFVNKARIENVKLSKNLYGKIEKTNNSEEKQKITNKSLILKNNFIFENDNDNLNIVEGVTDSNILTEKKYYDVQELIYEGDYEDFKLIKNYYNLNCGLFEIEIDIEPSYFQKYKYVILKEGEVVFESGEMPVDTIVDNKIICATRNVGYQRMVCYFFDYNGGVSILDDSKEFLPPEPKLKLGAYGINGREKPLELWSTFYTNLEHDIVPQNLNGELDINNWDQSENNPTQIISSYYNNNYDQISTWTKINEFNSIPINHYSNLPVNIHGYSYSTIIFDIVPNQGVNEIGIAYFQNEPFDKVEMEWNGEEIGRWLTEFVGKLNNEVNTKISDFTWSLQKYSNNPLSNIEDTHFVIVAKSKDESNMSENIRVYNDGNIREGYDKNYFKEDVRAWTVVDAMVQFVFSPEVGDLHIEIGDEEMGESEFNFQDFDSLKVKLNSFFENLEGVFPIYDEENEIVYIYSKENIYMEHPSFGGIQKDIKRAEDSNLIVDIGRGSEISIGEPIFARIGESSLGYIKDPKWTLRRENDNEIITTQNSLWFRSVLTKKGSYTLIFEYVDYFGNTKNISYNGCFIIVNT